MFSASMHLALGNGGLGGYSSMDEVAEVEVVAENESATGAATIIRDEPLRVPVDLAIISDDTPYLVFNANSNEKNTLQRSTADIKVVVVRGELQNQTFSYLRLNQQEQADRPLHTATGENSGLTRRQYLEKNIVLAHPILHDQINTKLKTFNQGKAIFDLHETSTYTHQSFKATLSTPLLQQSALDRLRHSTGELSEITDSLLEFTISRFFPVGVFNAKYSNGVERAFLNFFLSLEMSKEMLRDAASLGTEFAAQSLLNMVSTALSKNRLIAHNAVIGLISSVSDSNFIVVTAVVRPNNRGKTVMQCIIVDASMERTSIPEYISKFCENLARRVGIKCSVREASGRFWTGGRPGFSTVQNMFAVLETIQTTPISQSTPDFHKGFGEKSLGQTEETSILDLLMYDHQDNGYPSRPFPSLAHSSLATSLSSSLFNIPPSLSLPPPFWSRCACQRMLGRTSQTRHLHIPLPHHSSISLSMSPFWSRPLPRPERAAADSAVTAAQAQHGAARQLQEKMAAATVGLPHGICHHLMKARPPARPRRGLRWL
jgi:hypothetical protein